MAQILEGDGVGVALADFNPAARQSSDASLLEPVAAPGMTERRVAAGQRHFSLDGGVSRFRTMYVAMDAILKCAC